ncbi:MAG: flavodoxin family protein [Acidobacteria bacterium]|nr:MAG: flavodoxin family protein [Acidobacteriota bacterium]
MKAIAICGSPRVEGNTELLLQVCLERLTAAGVDTELVRLAEKEVLPCKGCGTCGKRLDRKCSTDSDDFHEVFEKMLEADIIILGSPVYFGSATPQMMALLDRAGYVSRKNGNLFSRKLGGPVVVARRAGQNFTYAQLLYWFMINDMIVTGSSYWNIAFGAARGEVSEDREGLETVARFADNLAWLASKVCSNAAPQVEPEAK